MCSIILFSIVASNSPRPAGPSLPELGRAHGTRWLTSWPRDKPAVCGDVFGATEGCYGILYGM